MTTASKSWEIRRLKAEAARLTSPPGGRLLDMGVELRVVERDANGTYQIPGIPDLDARYRVVATHRRGGMLDTLARRWVGPSQNPLLWHASPVTAPLILHGGPQSGQLVLGGEGSGKTRLGAQWLLWHCMLGFRSSRIRFGMTAPTVVRVQQMIQAIREHTRPEWFTLFAEAQEIWFRTGPRVDFRSVHIKSEADGSPIQSFTWAGCWADEWQDYRPSIEGDIEARGRGAPHGFYRRLNTMTPKTTTDARDAVTAKRHSDDWTVTTLRGFDNLFVPAAHWARIKRAADSGAISQRDYRRRVLAEDLPPELSLYPSFDRERNLRELPLIGATDVTERVLWERWGERFGLLLGHDPGEIYDVTVMLRAYELAGTPGHSWWIVGEVTTDRSTTLQHISVLLERLRAMGYARADGLRVLAIGDPWVEGETHPDKSVATAFRNAGITMRPAAYAKRGTGPGQIKKEARIDLVDSLFGCGRLIFEADRFGRAVATRTLHSAESAERSPAGKPEAERKGLRDVSHWMASVGYALHPHERVLAVRAARSS